MTVPKAKKVVAPNAKKPSDKTLAKMNLDEVRIFGFKLNKQITQLQSHLQQASRLMQGVYARETELLKEEKKG